MQRFKDHLFKKNQLKNPDLMCLQFIFPFKLAVWGGDLCHREIYRKSIGIRTGSLWNNVNMLECSVLNLNV